MIAPTAGDAPVRWASPRVVSHSARALSDVANAPIATTAQNEMRPALMAGIILPRGAVFNRNFDGERTSRDENVQPRGLSVEPSARYVPGRMPGDDTEPSP